MTFCWRDYQVTIPDGWSGRWAIEHFTVQPELAEILNAHRRSPEIEMLDSIMGEPEDDRYVEPGTYTRLVQCQPGVYPHACWMSDTRPEIEDHAEFISRAHGDVLIHGLGLGMCALAAARKPEVNTVTVYELSKDVIRLVADSVVHPKISIVQGSAFRRVTKRSRWDVVWHDIWRDLSESNLSQMDKLETRFAPHCDWQASWQRGYCERRRNKLRALRSVAGLDLEIGRKQKLLLTRWFYFANGGPPVSP